MMKTRSGAHPVEKTEERAWSGTAHSDDVMGGQTARGLASEPGIALVGHTHVSGERVTVTMIPKTKNSHYGGKLLEKHWLRC